MTTNTYDDFSQDYDRFVNWQSRLAAEMPFLEELLIRVKTGNDQPMIVLDAACGTGMHTIELARRGYRAAGADLSPRMIEVAKKNAEMADQNLMFKAAGFSDLKTAFEDGPVFPFDAITCFGNSLPHLVTRDEIKTALADFASCLLSGGMLILQNRNFDAVMARRERWIGPQSYTEEDSDWLFLRFYDFNADGLITFNIVRLKREGGEAWTQAVSAVRLYPLLQEDLIKLLEETGYKDIRAYGKMEDTPFDPETSENLVVTAVKK